MNLLAEWLRDNAVLRNLRPQQGRVYLASCLRYAERTSRATFQAQIPGQQLASAACAIDWLFQHTNDEPAEAAKLDSLRREVCDLIPEDGSEEELVPGWDKILSASLRAIDYYATAEPGKLVSAAVCAYESCIDRVVEQALRDGRCGWDLTGKLEFEASSPVCRRELEFQKECLRRVVTGEHML